MTDTTAPSPLSSWWEHLLDALYPPLCPGCQTLVPERATACPRCTATLPWIGDDLCAVCGIPLGPGERGTCRACVQRQPAFRAGRSALHYEGMVQRAIIAWKYRGLAYYHPLMRHWMQRFCATQPTERVARLDAICPVPLHPDRLRWRGFNQAAILAEAVAETWERPLWRGAVLRIHATPPQQRQGTRAQRWRNQEGAFWVPDRGLVAGKRICLVDDVATTGATLHACALALHAAGARTVTFVTLARQYTLLPPPTAPETNSLPSAREAVKREGNAEIAADYQGVADQATPSGSLHTCN